MLKWAVVVYEVSRRSKLSVFRKQIHSVWNTPNMNLVLPLPLKMATNLCLDKKILCSVSLSLTFFLSFRSFLLLFLFRNGGSEVKKFAPPWKVNTISIGYRMGPPLSPAIMLLPGVILLACFMVQSKGHVRGKIPKMLLFLILYVML